MASQATGQVLLDEDWQTDPLLGNGLQIKNEVVNPFPGWTYSDTAVRMRNSNNNGDIPDDSSVTDSHGHNQTIELNGDNSVIEYDFAHTWSASDVFQLRVEIAPSSWGGANQRYVRPELRQTDGTVLWSTSEDASTAIPTLPIDGNNNYFGTLPDYPSELTYFFTIDASTFTTGAEGQPIRLRLDSSGQRSVYINQVRLTLEPIAADSSAPAPDPVTWEVVPTVQNFTEITMRADSVIDDLYGVEYFFENTVTNSNSGWQDSREWTETGLAYNTNFTYRVKARDKSPVPNETGWSTSESAMTPPQDLTPPSPDPLTWDTAPTVADYRAITMSVNAATDISGVEYNFYNVTNATESGWQDSRFWTQKDLAPDTEYTYEVKARDKSLDQNVSTTPTTQLSATTPAEPAGTLYITRFQDPLLGNGIDGDNASFDLGAWQLTGRLSDFHVRYGGANGVPDDTDVSPNQAIQFEYTDRILKYDLDHNWSSTDTFTITMNVAPQDWNGNQQRYIRPSLEQHNGTLLWDTTGDDVSTAVPVMDVSDLNEFENSDWQSEPSLLFSWTIPATSFVGGAEGQPISLLINSSGFRGLIIDNVSISVSSGGGGGGNPYDTWSGTFGGLSDTNPELDFDGGSLDTGLEWVLEGDPTDASDDAGIAPTGDNSDPTYFTFTFRRSDAANADANTTIAVEYGSDLSGWTEAVHNGTTIIITENDDAIAAGVDEVVVQIDKSLGGGGKMFARLKATVATP